MWKICNSWIFVERSIWVSCIQIAPVNPVAFTRALGKCHFQDIKLLLQRKKVLQYVSITINILSININTSQFIMFQLTSKNKLPFKIYITHNQTCHIFIYNLYTQINHLSKYTEHHPKHKLNACLSNELFNLLTLYLVIFSKKALAMNLGSSTT